MNTFTAGSSIKFGWETFKKRAWFFIGATFLFLVVLAIVRPVQSHAMGIAAVLDTIAAFIIAAFLDMSMIAFFLKAHDNPMSVKLADFWHPQSFWSYLIALALVGFMAVVGFMLLIIPGLIVISMYLFVKFVIVERNLGPIDAMRESAHLTKGHRLELLLLVLFAIVINMIGALLLLVGLLVTIPTTVIAVAHAYRTLSHQNSETSANV